MAATAKQIVLVTGANSGIGFEAVAQMITDASKHVLLGSRSLEKGKAAIADLESRKQPGTAELLLLDVASEESINAAAKQVQQSHGRIDVLVNNAAVGIPNCTLAEQMAISFQTNATGALLMGEAFAPLLQKSTGTPRIINVSSGAGLVRHRLDPNSPSGPSAPWYRASKAALNMITAHQIVEYGSLGWKVFGYTPGFVVSNLGSHNTADNGAQPTITGSMPIVEIVNGERDDEHGLFLRPKGRFEW